jgi:hypothetical protein
MPQYPMMPYNNFIYPNYSPDKKGVPQPMPYYLPNMMPTLQQQQALQQQALQQQQAVMPRFESVNRRVSAPEVSAHLPPGLQALTAAAQSELPIARRSSAPECPFPLPHMGNAVYMKPPMMEYPQGNELPSLPPLTKMNPSEMAYKSSNIHNILHNMPVQHQPIEPIEPSAHNVLHSHPPPQGEKSASDAALLFQNFCDQVQEGTQDSDTSSRKRSFSLPPVNDLAAYSTSNDSNKKPKVEEVSREYFTTSPVVSI